MKTKRKKNPQDATLRNIRALKKRVAYLEETLFNVIRRIELVENKCERSSRY